MTEQWAKSSRSLNNGNCLEWRTSTRSAANGNCVEWRTATRSMENGACVQWRKATASSENGCCVEAQVCRCDVETPVAQVRDSKDPNGGVLTFPAGPWRAFIRMVAAGES